MAADLLTRIASCEIARHHTEDSSFSSPCKEIVCSQGARSWDEFQVPEPWNGSIESAPILYISSNPSISQAENYPRGRANRDQLIDFFDGRFRGKWVRGGTRPLENDGQYGPPVRYWAGILARTSELLERPAVPGFDYAITEIVHCKSRQELGVQEALSTCAERYLQQILRCSEARLVVLVGKKSLRYFNSIHVAGLPEVPPRDGTDILKVFDRDRVFAYLGHPTGPEPKRFEACLPKRIAFVREFLRGKSQTKSGTRTFGRG